MRKVVINKCYGEFELSAAGRAFMEAKGHDPRAPFTRDNPTLVACVEELGDLASGRYVKLRIVEIPEDVNWVIKEHDGMEHIAEIHRTWDRL